MVKDYAQKLAINFDKIFSPIIYLVTIRVVLAIATVMDLGLEKLNIKITFLHGDIKKEIYMM